MMSDWLQMNRSGFFFRRVNGRLVQGALIVCDNENQSSWATCSALAAQNYYETRPALFHKPDATYLAELQLIPFEPSVGLNDYAWALQIIAS